MGIDAFSFVKLQRCHKTKPKHSIKAAIMNYIVIMTIFQQQQYPDRTAGNEPRENDGMREELTMQP